MAKTNTNHSPIKTKKEKQNLDKTKNKLKRLLDSKGIVSPTTTTTGADWNKPDKNMFFLDKNKNNHNNNKNKINKPIESQKTTTTVPKLDLGVVKLEKVEEEGQNKPTTKKVSSDKKAKQPDVTNKTMKIDKKRSTSNHKVLPEGSDKPKKALLKANHKDKTAKNSSVKTNIKKEIVNNVVPQEEAPKNKINNDKEANSKSKIKSQTNIGSSNGLGKEVRNATKNKVEHSTKVGKTNSKLGLKIQDINNSSNRTKHNGVSSVSKSIKRSASTNNGPTISSNVMKTILSNDCTVKPKARIVQDMVKSINVVTVPATLHSKPKTLKEQPTLRTLQNSGNIKKKVKKDHRKNAFKVEDIADDDLPVASTYDKMVFDVQSDMSINSEESDSEMDMDCTCDSELSVGSGAEEILTDGGSLSRSESPMDEMILPDVRRPVVGLPLDDEWSNASSDDSCPELVPIYPDVMVSEDDDDDEDWTEESDEFDELSEEQSEEWTEQSEEEDEWPSQSNGWNLESDETIESTSESDEKTDDNDDYSDDTSGLFDFSNPLIYPDDEPSSSDNNYSDLFEDTLNAISYSDDDDDDSQFDNYDDDPHCFETTRKPIQITIAPSANISWSKCPINLNQSDNNHYNNNYYNKSHNTSIQEIIRRFKLENPRPKSTKTTVNNQQVEQEHDDDENDEDDEEEEEEITKNVNDDTTFDEDAPIEDEVENEISTVHVQDNQVEQEEDDEEAVDMEETFDNEEIINNVLNTNTTVVGQKQSKESDPRLTRPRFFNSLDSRQVLLVLKSELHFHGILKVTLLAGNAKIYGYSLRPNQPVTAYSPRGHRFVSIEPVRTRNSAEESQKSVYLDTVQEILMSMESGFISQDIYAAIECFNPTNDVLLLLESSDRQMHVVNMIQRYMRQSIFPNVHTFNPRGVFYNSEFILRAKFFMYPRPKLRLGPKWSELPLESNTRTVVIGGKGVGKSTFVRFSANASIQKFGRVLLIDLDIGQPELFVPQTISATLLTEPILGPGYLMNKSPDLALLFGEINVTVAPLKYYRCVLKLLRYCAANPAFADVPWIVNTMGYNKGFGPELIAAVLRAFNGFTDVVQIQAHRFLDNYPTVMTADVINEYSFNFFHAELNAFTAADDQPPANVAYRTHVFMSMARRFGEKSGGEWAMSAKDTRFAIVLSNLGALLKDGCEWITDLKPVCTSLSNLKIIASDEVSPDQHLRLLNGNLVYLCRQTDDDSSDIVECFGIGIVRAVDHTTNKVYLLPATSETNLALTNALAVCNTPLPSSLMTNHNRRVSGRVPYVYSTDHFIGSKHVVPTTYRPATQQGQS